jgi:hypothetical protein
MQAVCIAFGVTRSAARLFAAYMADHNPLFRKWRCVRRLNFRARPIVVRTDTSEVTATVLHTDTVMCEHNVSAYKHSGCVRAVVVCTDTVDGSDAERSLSVLSLTTTCIQRKRLTDLPTPTTNQSSSLSVLKLMLTPRTGKHDLDACLLNTLT